MNGANIGLIMRLISHNRIISNICMYSFMVICYGIMHMMQIYYRYNKVELSGLGAVCYLLLFFMMTYVTLALGFHMGNLATLQHLEDEEKRK
jgi:hypothetical protein